MIDDWLTMAPPPFWRICRISCFMQKNTPRKFTSMWKLKPSSRLLGDGLEAHDAGVVHRAVKTAIGLDRLRDHGFDVPLDAHVCAREEPLAACRADHVEVLAPASLVDIGKRDPRPLAGEGERRDPAETSRCAGDERNFPSNRAMNLSRA